jgi:hypothetical protein
MNDVRKKADWAIVVALVVALMLVPLAGYFGAYFALGNLGTQSTQYESWPCRFYSTQWQADMFWFAAQVESILTRRDVKTGSMPQY